MHDFKAIGRIYQHSKSSLDGSHAHKKAGPKQSNLEQGKKKKNLTDKVWHVYTVLRNNGSMAREQK